MDKEKIGLVFLRFVSILFLILQKGEKQQKGPGLFKIYEYTFFNIWKGHQEKIGPDCF